MIPSREVFTRLHAVLSKYLSPTIANLLAEPIVSEDSSHIEWYTQFVGQPLKLNELSGLEQSHARRLLGERLDSVRDLATKIAKLDPQSDLSERLVQAITYPNEDTIFVVGGQPVITFWGYGLRSPQSPPADARLISGWSKGAVGILLGLGLVCVLIWLAFYLSFLRWPPWGPDYSAMLVAEQSNNVRLRHELLDQRGRLAGLLGRCALQSQFDALRQERALLVPSLESAEGRVRERLMNCKKK